MTEAIIKKDMTIGEVVQKYPRVAAVFQNYGLQCVGCSVAYWETVEQGAKGHGMPEETIQEMIVEANKVAEKQEKEVQNSDEPLIVTTAAVEKVKSLLAKEGKSDQYLRIRVVSGGCSGMSYDFLIDKEIKEEDEQLEKDGLKILVDKESMSTLKGATIDYVDALTGAGFKVHNPNATNTCGCGSSFS